MNSEKIDLAKILRILLMQSKLFVGIVLISFIFWIYLYIKADRIYRIESLLNVDTSSQDLQQNISGAILGGNDTAKLENQVILYKTRSNIITLIDELNLHYNFYDEKQIDDIDIVNFRLNIPQEFQRSYTLKKFDDKSFLVFLDSDDAEPIKLPFNRNNILNDFTINVANINSNEKIKIIFPKIEQVIKRYRNSLIVTAIATSRSFYMNSGGLMNINYATSNPKKGIEIINKANEIFITKNILDQSEKAKKAVAFIDERLDTIETLLELNKEKLKSFQKDNATINVDIETESILKSLTEAQRELTELELEEANIIGSYTESNPLYINLQNQKFILKEQIDNLEDKIRSLPSSQQEYIELYRDLEVSQTIYSDLINKKLSFQIIEASTIGNIRVVDEAYRKDLISPSLGLGLFNIIISSILAFFICLIRGVYFSKITNPAEILDNNNEDMPIIGIIPFESESEHNASLLQEAYQSITLNLRLLSGNKEDDCIVVGFSSASPENGKTFCSRKIAQSMANNGKKVALIDGDYKRGDIHQYFDISTSKEIPFRYEIDSAHNVSSNLYVYPRVSNMRNSFQFFDSNAFKNDINNLKKEFDLIIIDTPPYLSVSDATILLNIADVRVLVCRHNVNRLAEINETIRAYAELGPGFDGIIYNSYSKPKGYFGYYQYYGNYQYQYYADRYLYNSYDYDKD